MGMDGWTQTPNYILDNMANMKPAVFKVCMVVVRKTCGYSNGNGGRKEWDRISLSQLIEATGLSNKGVINATNEAIEQGWIERREDGQWYEYRVCEPCQSSEDSSLETNEDSSQVDESSEHSSPKVVNIVHTQKKEINKHTFSNEKVPTPNGAAPARASPKKEAKKRPSTAYTHPDTGVSTQDIFNAYEQALINAEPGVVVQYGREKKAAKQLAQAGKKPSEVVTAFWKMKKGDKFWQGTHLSLQAVATNFGAVMNGHKATLPPSVKGTAFSQDFQGSEA